MVRGGRASGGAAQNTQIANLLISVLAGRTVALNPSWSARFSSRTGPMPENGPRFFEGFKGICEGDRTSETEERPKIGL